MTLTVESINSKPKSQIGFFRKAPKRFKRGSLSSVGSTALAVLAVGAGILNINPDEAKNLYNQISPVRALLTTAVTFLSVSASSILCQEFTHEGMHKRRFNDAEAKTAAKIRRSSGLAVALAVAASLHAGDIQSAFEAPPNNVEHAPAISAP